MYMIIIYLELVYNDSKKVNKGRRNKNKSRIGVPCYCVHPSIIKTQFRVAFSTNWRSAASTDFEGGLQNSLAAVLWGAIMGNDGPLFSNTIANGPPRGKVKV